MICTDFEFEGDLHTVRYKDRPQEMDALFIVEQEYWVTFKLDGKDCEYGVAEGTTTDLASIPKVVPRWIVQQLGPHIEAAVVHDRLCIDQAPWDSQTAANIFLAGMIAGRTPAWKARSMYEAVYYFGPQWGY
jgi:hypothetical protein